MVSAPCWLFSELSRRSSSQQCISSSPGGSRGNPRPDGFESSPRLRKPGSPFWSLPASIWWLGFSPQGQGGHCLKKRPNMNLMMFISGSGYWSGINERIKWSKSKWCPTWLSWEHISSYWSNLTFKQFTSTWVSVIFAETKLSPSKVLKFNGGPSCCTLRAPQVLVCWTFKTLRIIQHLRAAAASLAAIKFSNYSFNRALDYCTPYFARFDLIISPPGWTVTP